ncbi:MAG: sugar transferase [Acutalibacteraceae bacterium]
MQTDEVKIYYDIVKRKRISRSLKRLLDIILSVIIIVILALPMAIIACFVGFGSKGGVFFRQTRITTYGRAFRIFKFRTMISDAEQKGSQITTKDDCRITKQGKFLRKFKLDELPQIFNVFLGDMSIVGTRPEVPKYVEKYTPEMYATLLLPAGITSLASIKYKDEQQLLESSKNVDDDYINKVLPDKMRYNLEYVKRFNILYDIKLMFATVFGVFLSK